MVNRHIRSLRVTALAAALIAAPLALTAAPAHALSGAAASGTTYSYTARLDIGDGTRACSGVLVDAEWLLTAASCFVADPAAGLTVPAGRPQLTTTATIGRTDLTTTDGEVRTVVELVPRTDRDLVLARLNRPVTSVAPVSLATTAATAGETLTGAGYGRTKDEWAPLALHTGTFSVDSATATTASVTGQNGTAICAGDAGGPQLRVTSGKAELVAVNSQSWQGGCFGTDTTETRTGGVATRVDDLGGWIASKAGATRVADFNCDGVEDTAIADPNTSAGGVSQAGVVRIVYGGGKGTQELSRALSYVPGDPETGDLFGQTLATVDYDEDGCTDLVVGAPSVDIGTATDAGAVYVLYGGPDGIGSGKAATDLEEGAATNSMRASTPETGDRLGAALAAGTTAAGEPWLLIGVPGEGLNGIAKAGEAFYLRGSTDVSIYQGRTADVPGTSETNDGFGATVAGDGNFIAIGTPNEGIGTAAAAGGVAVFGHTLNAAGIPTPRIALSEDLDTVTGSPEANDEFGGALSMTAYRPAGATSASDSVLAIGVPGESLTVSGTDRAEAGRVVTVHITASGAWSQLGDISQESADVDGTGEAGDRFGQTVATVNTAPRAESTASTLHLAVGVPDEDLGTAADAGGIQTFSLLGAPGDTDAWVYAGNGTGLPGTYGASQYVGSSITATGTNLYVGMPYGPSAYGAAYALPWSNVTGGTVAAVTTYQPGAGGLPAAGVRFGYAVK
ncbi:trypsin-like serine protease [Streptomyces sp. NPDC054770]